MNMKKDPISILLRSKNMVFTFKDLSLLWNETNANLVKKYAYRYVKLGKLHPIRRGIYAKDKNYDNLELATKIFTPAYISFETVLAKEGVIFQRYNQIFVASYLTREIFCEGQAFVFRRMKEAVLLNTTGLDKKDNYHIATKERAFLDTIYLNKSYQFDNLSSINWDECFEMISLYENKAMAIRLNSYYKVAEHA